MACTTNTFLALCDDMTRPVFSVELFFHSNFLIYFGGPSLRLHLAATSVFREMNADFQNLQLEGNKSLHFNLGVFGRNFPVPHYKKNSSTNENLISHWRTVLVYLKIYYHQLFHCVCTSFRTTLSFLLVVSACIGF